MLGARDMFPVQQRLGTRIEGRSRLMFSFNSRVGSRIRAKLLSKSRLGSQSHLVCRFELDSASDAELACRSPCVSAPSCSRRLATADAKRCSPLMSDDTMRYLGGCTWLLRCVRPSCCTCLQHRSRVSASTLLQTISHDLSGCEYAAVASMC